MAAQPRGRGVRRRARGIGGSQPAARQRVFVLQILGRRMTRSRKRLSTFIGVLLATAGLIVAACFAVNCLVDPLWYLRGNVLSEINYPFNERLSKLVRFLPRMADYDCVIFGTSRATLLPAEKAKGYRCFNMALSH